MAPLHTQTTFSEDEINQLEEEARVYRERPNRKLLPAYIVYALLQRVRNERVNRALMVEAGQKIQEQKERIITLTNELSAADKTLADNISEIEAYRTALEHIKNGHPNPVEFASILLAIGKD